MSDSLYPVAVIGCGKMGRLHARCWSQIPGVRLVGVYDRHAPAAEDAAKQYGTQAVSDLSQLLETAKAVSIASNTDSHLAVAEPFLRRGIACLIEKPLARNSAECRKIVELARANNAVVQVGHIERFNPIIVALRKLDIRPAYLETSRVSPMTFRSLDVGVVLDMMVHDIDIVLSLVNSPPVKVEASGAAVLGDTEDICSARVTFQNGAAATLSASRLALKTERRLRLYAKDCFVSIDYGKKTGAIFRASDNVAALQETAQRVRRGEVDPTTLNYAQMVKMQELAVENTEPIRAELEAFLAAAQRKCPSPIPAEAGAANVELAEKIVTAMGANRPS